MARTSLEMVERGWRPCVSGSVVDSSERENGSAMSNGKEAQESFGFLVSYSQVCWNAISFSILGHSESRIAKAVLR